MANHYLSEKYVYFTGKNFYIYLCQGDFVTAFLGLSVCKITGNSLNGFR